MNNVATARVNRLVRVCLTVPLVVVMTLLAVQGAGAQSIFVSSRTGNQGVLEFDATSGAFLRTFVPAGVGGINQPDGIAVGPDGAVYVASNEMGDPDATAVLRYDADTGAFLGQFVTVRFGNTTDITFGPNGNLFAANFTTRVVEEFDGSSGAFVRVFATQPASACCPLSLAFGPNGNLYLTDELGVEEFNGVTGTLVNMFPMEPTTYGLAFATDGSMLVSHAAPSPGQVRKYDAATGAQISVLVPPGTLTMPHAVRIGPDGLLYVPDRVTKQVTRFDPSTGALIDVFIAPGSGGLNDPMDLAFKPAAVSYEATIQPPVNADGSSVFKTKRGVVPIKFRLTANGTPTCDLPAATIEVVRTAGGVLGVVNEAEYIQPSDVGSNFRIDPAECQYVYNLGSSTLGVGTYLVKIKIAGLEVGSGSFSLK